ncbi:MAG: hypothetical protein H0X51_09750 [Parachlamydiaceae bacterium]|nr:hypothetical protein [Parachlamydiaceae bacterium]
MTAIAAARTRDRLTPLSAALIRNIVLLGNFHDMARMRRVSKVCWELLNETSLTIQTPFNDILYQYNVEKLLRHTKMDRFTVAGNLRANVFTFTFAACTATRTLITNKKSSYILNQHGKSVLKTNSGKIEEYLYNCRHLSSSSDPTTFWNKQQGYQLSFDDSLNELMYSKPAQEPTSDHPLNVAPYVFAVGEYLFAICQKGKISCFDTTGCLLNEKNFFPSVHQKISFSLYQLGSYFLFVLEPDDLQEENPPQFFAVSCDETLSLLLLESDLALTHYYQPLGSNGQSCFVALCDRAFRTFQDVVVALTIKDKKLQILWKSSLIHSQESLMHGTPKHCIFNERYVVIWNEKHDIVLCATSGKIQGTIPKPTSLRKIIGAFLIYMGEDYISTWNLSTKEQMQKLHIKQDDLHRIDDVYFQGPGKKPHDLPLDRFYVLHTSRVNQESLKAGISVYSVSKEQLKQAAAKAEAKAQPKRAAKKRKIGT